MPIFEFSPEPIFLVLCLIIIGRLLLDIYWANKCKAWPTTEGRIIYSKKKGGAGRRGYSASVKYSYEVDGKQYESSRIYFGGILTLDVIAQGYVNRYPKGRKVKIYYHPVRPKLATLETELPFETYIILLLFVPFSFLIISML